MNRQILGNILTISIILLVVSGVIMFVYPYNKDIASMHTVFGIVISVSILFHIFNNRILVLAYIKGGKYKSLLLIGGLSALGLSIYIGVPYTDVIYNLGNQIRNEKSGKKEISLDYESIILPSVNEDYKISFEFKKGDSFKYPLFAAWVEDTTGIYLETLYISESISGSTFKFAKMIDDKWMPGIVRRPEALPCWSHSRAIKAEDGLFVPLHTSPDLDAVSGATPQNSFIIKSGSSLNGPSKFCIKFELNQSFDWNEFYTKDKFPNDTIYSGSGQVGQPSVIYSLEIDKNEIIGKGYYFMKPVGHGHHSGLNGVLYDDMSTLSSALDIADRIIVSIEKS